LQNKALGADRAQANSGTFFLREIISCLRESFHACANHFMNVRLGAKVENTEWHMHNSPSKLICF
jgi:hypothetical protein